MSSIVLKKPESIVGYQRDGGTQLNEDEMQKVNEIAGQIDLSEPNAVSIFGKELCNYSSEMTDDLLRKIRSNDADIIGGRLNEVLQLARETTANIDFTPKSARARVMKAIHSTPVIGPIAKRLTRTVNGELDKYESAAHQIDSVIKELNTAVEAINQTSCLLDRNFHEVVESNRMLEIHIQAGQKALERHKEKLEEPFDVNDPIAVQAHNDLAAAFNIMEKRIADLMVRQNSGYQALPSIRMIQANTRQLAEKFDTIKEVTIPAWKQGFVIRGALTQQMYAVSLTEAIDKTTNDLLLQNANLLHDNSVRTAKANQRLIIDPKTLEKTGNMLIKTTEEVMQIRREGRAAREESIKQLEAIRKEQASKTLFIQGGNNNPRITH